ncbi:MAG: hypothetical protein ACPGVP_19010, partial [Thiolinea sp.]
KGFVPQHLPGNGLKNMEHRARKIKAGFVLESNPQGTAIIVTLPVFVQLEDSLPDAENNNSLAGDS